MKILKKVFQFIALWLMAYLALPIASFFLVAILSFLFWEPIDFRKTLEILNPENNFVMRLIFIISFIYALIMTIKHKSLKEFFNK